MCGIFGGSAKKGKKLNLRKLTTLGLYNIQRGTDSCGYYFNGNIVKGVGDEANFSKFIAKHKLLRGELPCEVFMGHTRKSTSGTNTADNAHPHQVGNYVQTHNGVIKNIWKLCSDNKIDHTGISVDSIGLAHIIEKHGFNILNGYEGYAALTMTFVDDPHSLYLYHGASKEFKYGEPVEERPLFFLDTAEGIYYSSIKESLDLINESKKKVHVIPHNHVYKIQHGVFTNFDYVVERDEANAKTTTNWYNTGRNLLNNNEIPFTQGATTNKKPLLPVVVGRDKILTSIAMKESYPPEFKTQDIYFRRGRYCRAANILLHGEYHLTRKGKIVTDPFKCKELVETFYFLKGVMLKSKKEYKRFLKDYGYILDDNSLNFAFYISSYSRYPVMAIENEGIGVAQDLKNYWYKNEKRVSLPFTPKFAARSYTIKEGLLNGIQRAFDGEKTYIPASEKVLPHIVDDQNISDKELILGLILQTIKDWSKTIVTLANVTTIPEIVLMFIDFYNETYLVNGKAMTDKQIEEETEIVIKDLIHGKYNFQYYLSQLFNPDFISYANVSKCFKGYEPDELLEFDNRFLLSDFGKTVEPPKEKPKEVKAKDLKGDAFGKKAADLSNKLTLGAAYKELNDKIDSSVKSLEKNMTELTEAVKKNEEDQSGEDGVEERSAFIEFVDSYSAEHNESVILLYGEKVVDDIVDVELLADQLQLIDTDEAQLLAFNIYNLVDKAKKDVEELLKHAKYKEILKPLKVINCIC